MFKIQSFTSFPSLEVAKSKYADVAKTVENGGGSTGPTGFTGPIGPTGSEGAPGANIYCDDFFIRLR